MYDEDVTVDNEDEEVTLEDETVNQDDLNEDPRIANLSETVDRLEESNKQLTALLNRALPGQQTQKEPEKPYEPQPLPEDFDDLTNTQVLNIQSERLIAHMEANVVKPLLDKIATLGNDTKLTSAQVQIKEARDANPDFEVLKEEITAEISAGASIANAVILARAKNPDKVAKFEASQKSETEDKKVTKKPFTLRPSSDGKQAEKPISRVQDAGDAAWDETGAEILAQLQREME